MKIRVFPKITVMDVEYVPISHCPLCGAEAELQGQLTRSAYRFGLLSIPIPSQGIKLLRCLTCDLLFKDLMPSMTSLTAVMTQAAEDEWREKAGEHPSLWQVVPFLNGGAVIDIGAAQGDLLRSLKPYATVRSAFDVVVYERCREAVSGEYIVSTFEDVPEWSEEPYSVVTAFDVFEHFLDTPRAINNIVGFLGDEGHLIIETGDWRSVADLGAWYYCNLFEHQIFWSARSIEHMCKVMGLEQLRCERLSHKFRRNVSFTKRMAIRVFIAAGFALGPLTGIDARLLPPPSPNDHLYAVLRKRVNGPVITS